MSITRVFSITTVTVAIATAGFHFGIFFIPEIPASSTLRFLIALIAPAAAVVVAKSTRSLVAFVSGIVAYIYCVGALVAAMQPFAIWNLSQQRTTAGNHGTMVLAILAALALQSALFAVTLIIVARGSFRHQSSGLFFTAMLYRFPMAFALVVGGFLNLKLLPWLTQLGLFMHMLASVALISIAARVGLNSATLVIGRFGAKCPEELQQIIAEAELSQHAKFSRVIFLDNKTPQLFLAQVRSGFGICSTLLINRSTVNALTKRELIAVLNHELSHIRHRHLAKDLCLTTGSAFMAALSVLAVSALFGQKIPDWTLMALILLSFAISEACRVWVWRKWETTADVEAARCAGLDVTVSSISKLHGLGAFPQYGTLQERLLRLHTAEP